jgi:hypothetical protein
MPKCSNSCQTHLNVLPLYLSWCQQCMLDSNPGPCNDELNVLPLGYHCWPWHFDFWLPQTWFILPTHWSSAYKVSVLSAILVTKSVPFPGNELTLKLNNLGPTFQHPLKLFLTVFFLFIRWNLKRCLHCAEKMQKCCSICQGQLCIFYSKEI